ncbi:MAG: hypothetical protein AAGC67_10380 [Myxococcota bacterium]
MSLSSARSITASVHPPRAVFTDFPLGRTAGKPNDPASQDLIVRAALDHLASAERPGEIRSLDLRWAETDDWKDAVMRPAPASVDGDPGRAEDDRRARTAEPQYQFPEDLDAVVPDCPTCFVPAAR